MRTIFLFLIILNYIICDFSSKIYFNKPANEKLNLLWNKITENQTPLGFYSAITTATIFIESMNPSFETVGDEFLDSRKKLIHTVGRVAQVEFVSTNNHQYTGVFEGCKNGLIRLSCAKQPNPSKSKAQEAIDNFTPGFALKFLRDGYPSANLQAMYGVNGQESWNFFKNNFSNHIPAATGLALKALALKFSSATYFIQTLGLRDLALINQNGDIRTSPKYPFKLIFKPNEELRNKFPDDFKLDYMDQIKTVPKGSLLYTVFAVDQPNGTEVKIGEIKTKSEFVSSLWGDESLFFRHNFMDVDLKDNPHWEPFIPRHSIFGGEKVKGEGEKRKCPFLHEK